VVDSRKTHMIFHGRSKKKETEKQTKTKIELSGVNRTGLPTWARYCKRKVGTPLPRFSEGTNAG